MLYFPHVSWSRKQEDSKTVNEHLQPTVSIVLHCRNSRLGRIGERHLFSQQTAASILAERKKKKHSQEKDKCQANEAKTASVYNIFRCYKYNLDYLSEKQMKSAVLGTLALSETSSSSLGSFLRVQIMGWTEQFPLINDSAKSAGRERVPVKMLQHLYLSSFLTYIKDQHTLNINHQIHAPVQYKQILFPCICHRWEDAFNSLKTACLLF